MFETLDTKTGRVFLSANNYVGLIDTVGFINNIPTQLIESFKATLEELIFADALINVVDVSDYDYRNKEKVTKDILRLANVNENKIKNMITVYNKCDLNPYMNNIDRINVISAYTGQGIDKFKTMLLSH